MNMNYHEYDMDLVERYFDDELSADEKAMVEARVHHDAIFRKIFEDEKMLIGAIRFEGIRKNLEFLEEKERALSSQRRFFIPGRWLYLSAAACVGAIALFLAKPWVNKSDRLFEAYFTPYPNLFETTMRGSGQSTEATEAYQAYEQEDFEKASTLFEKLSGENPSAGMLLLLGNAQLTLGKTQRAKATLTDLINNYNTLDVEAKWYLGLASLREGDEAEAIAYFREVAGTDNVFSHNARDVLNELQ